MTREQEPGHAGFDHPRALCRGVDPAIWFPPTYHAADVAPAKAICKVCPARVACLEYALEHDEKDGVWGGLTPTERRQEATQRYLRRRGILP